MCVYVSIFCELFMYRLVFSLKLLLCYVWKADKLIIYQLSFDTFYLGVVHKDLETFVSAKTNGKYISPMKRVLKNIKSAFLFLL